MSGPTQRSVPYEQEFLKQVEDEARRRYGLESVALVRAVGERLALGQKLYGDNWLTPDFDGIREGTEETPDVVCYALLELQRLNMSGLDEDGVVYAHLFEAALGAAYSDWHFRQARSVQRRG